MALTDRIVRRGIDNPNAIPIHELSAAFMLYAVGEVTRAQVISNFSLVGQEVTDFDSLKAKYDSLGTAVEKIAFIWKIEASGIFYQNATIDAAKYKQILGF